MTRSAWLLLGLVGAALVAGCGPGDDSDGAVGTPGPAPKNTDTSKLPDTMSPEAKRQAENAIKQSEAIQKHMQKEDEARRRAANAGKG